MTSFTDELEALLEGEEKVVRAREAAEDEQKRQEELAKSNQQGRNSNSNRYSAEREENDRRRSRKSGDDGVHIKKENASDDGSANGDDRYRRDHRYPDRRRSRSRSPRGRGARPRDFITNETDRPIKEERSDREDRAPPGGDYYSGSGRPARIDEYRPRGGRRSPRDNGRSRSPRRGHDGRGGRDRHRDRSPLRDHGRRGRGRDAAPEPADDEHDRRTVFVQQLANRVRTKDLHQFFEQAGEVVEAQIVKDKVSGKSKGVGYVEFKEEESVQRAIALTGQKLCGIPIIAQLTEAEKNRIAKTEGGPTSSNGVPFHRLYVGNIHFSITEDDLRNVFEPFGELEFVQLQKEEHSGRSKGYGFVQFHDSDQAKEALEKMNSFELAGRAIRVGLGNDKFTNESTQSILRNHASQFTGSSFSGAGGRGTHAGGNASFDRASGRDADKAAGGASALDDTDVGGVNFSNYSRDSLMRKLARTEDPEPKVQTKTTQQKKAPPITETQPTRCVLIKNMYNQAEETDPNWQAEIKEDVKDECENSYGPVKHIGLGLDNDDGEVYIKFADVSGAINAYRGLNGRHFGGRVLSADYVIEAMYHANFPKAKNV